MLEHVLSWRHRSPSKNAVEWEVDDLVLQFGANAGREARRREVESNDLSAARHWGSVASEIGRRIREDARRSTDRDRIRPEAWLIFTPADERADTRRLADIIARVPSDLSVGRGAGGGARGLNGRNGAAGRSKRDVVADLQAAVASLPVAFDDGETANCPALQFRDRLGGV